MTEPGDGRAVPLLEQPESPPARPPAPAVALSGLALIGSFAALLQVDIPILWFLRSHNLSSLQSLGDVGERLGNGGTLVMISLLILGAGLYLKRNSLTRLGMDSLFAHGVVALLVNGLKHVIGRPRPRLTHSGGWQWWPSLDSGLDSFPSGHTSASVAVGDSVGSSVASVTMGTVCYGRMGGGQPNLARISLPQRCRGGDGDGICGGIDL